MPNDSNLVAAHHGNTSRLQHGVYSTLHRPLDGRAREVADALMEAPHVVGLDVLAAQECGALVARIEAIDAELDRRARGSKGTATLLDLRLRASGRLERWLAAFGATPAARADWAARLARGGLGAEFAPRRSACLDAVNQPGESNGTDHA